MRVCRRFFPEIVQDNDEVYLAHLEGALDAVDEFASMEVTRSLSSYQFRLAASMPKYVPLLLREILKFHNMYGIRLELSKSIKSSGTINFEITTE